MKTIELERRRVRMVSIIKLRIDWIGGGRRIGGCLKSVPIGIEKCVP